MQRLWRWTAALVGLAALLLALGIGAFRLAIDLLPGYQQRVVDRVHEATGLTLQFDSVYARISRHGPEVVFRGARVLPATGDEPLVTAASGRVSLSIGRSLWYRRLEVGRVSFVRPRLSFVITTDGHIRLVGQSALQRRDEDHAPMTLDRLPRGHYAVDDATLDVLDLRSRQGRFQLTGANVDVRRQGDEITVVGRVELPEHLGSFIDFDGQATATWRHGEGRMARSRRCARPRSRAMGGDVAGQLPRAGRGTRLHSRLCARSRARSHEPARPAGSR